MPSPVDVVNTNAENAADTLIEFTASHGAEITKIPTNGHPYWGLTTLKGNAGAANVILKGTNNPDPADANGETIITNTHAGSDQKDGHAVAHGFKYVFVGTDAGNFAAGTIRVYGTGLPG